MTWPDQESFCHVAQLGCVLVLGCPCLYLIQQQPLLHATTALLHATLALASNFQACCFSGAVSRPVSPRREIVVLGVSACR